MSRFLEQMSASENEALTKKELRLRKKYGMICLRCRSVYEYSAREKIFCPTCEFETVAYRPPRFPLVLFFSFVYLAACFVFLCAVNDAHDLPRDIMLACIGLAMGAVFCWIIYIRRRHVFEKERKIALAQTLKEKKERGAREEVTESAELPMLAYYDDLAALDASFSDDEYAAARFIDGKTLGHISALRRTVEFRKTAPSESLLAAAERLYRYATLCGLHLTMDCVKALLVAMASGRVVCLEGEGRADAKRTVALLAGFFDCNAHATVIDPAWKNEYDILGVNAPNHSIVSLGATGLLLDLYTATLSPERVCISFLSDATVDSLTNCVFPILSKMDTDGRIALRKGANKISPARLEKGAVLPLTRGAWIFCELAEGQALDAETKKGITTVKITREMQDESFTLFPCTATPLGHADLTALLSCAEDANFLSEPVWQKCDLVFDYMRRELDLRVANRDILALERATSLFLALGGEDELAALDCGIALVLGARICAALQEKEEKRAAFVACVTELFGESGLPLLSRQAE